MSIELLTPTAILTNIHIYPIKSSAGIEVSNSWIDDLGLSFDRRFVLTALNGKFITARTDAKLCLIQANLTADGLIITAPNMPVLHIKYQEITQQYQNITVWRDEINSQLCHEKHHAWFSQYLNKPCQLNYFGEQSTRYVANSEKQVAFADGYPLLLISKASLAELNSRCSSEQQMSQFRPNIVVDQCDAFAEDSWHKIRIGEVIFEITKPCSRCVFTTINPKNGEFSENREPLKTLHSFRKAADGEVYFGQNLIALNHGQIKVGDVVEVISTKKADDYPDNTLKNKLSQPEKYNFDILTANQNKTANSTREDENVAKKINIMFDSWDLYYQGNDQDTLLEQGEAAGLIMNYSCRGGSCGSCKVKLHSGEVEQQATDGLTPQEQDEGYVLACSCVPKSDVVITKD